MTSGPSAAPALRAVPAYLPQQFLGVNRLLDDIQRPVGGGPLVGSNAEAGDDNDGDITPDRIGTDKVEQRPAVKRAVRQEQIQKDQVRPLGAQARQRLIAGRSFP